MRRTSPSAFAILTNCSATNHRAVFLGSPLPKKILAIQNVGRGGVRRTSPSAFAILTNCSAANHRAVFLISPLPTKNIRNHKWLRIFLVGRGGFGPPKSGDDRFTVCSLWPLGNLPIYGAGDWNRTHNLLITSQLLCQLSYTSNSFKKMVP